MRVVAFVSTGVLVVAGVWVDYGRHEGTSEINAGVPTNPAELPGFRADAWYLPEGPLLGFVEIPAGPAVMGSDPVTDPLAFDNERWSDSEARGTVEVPTFLIGRFEVTVAQYRAFVASTGYEVEAQPLTQPSANPVASVSWPDALAYTRWLDGVLRQWADAPPELARLLAAGSRVTLPSEAEWERAARAGDGRIYPWGDEPRQDRANFGTGRPGPVGAIACPECPFGLSDMAGNVWEWTRSPYQLYPYSDDDDREGLAEDALWVMRGGSFDDPPQNVRAATRGAAGPDVRRPFIGFRLVISRF